MTPCISAVIGDFGSCKTLFMVAMAKLNDGKRTIFANFQLFNIEYTPISIEDLSGFPDWLDNGIVLLDEGQVGAGIYDIFKKDVKELAIFITQIRKRNIFIFWTSQIFDRVAKPLRMYTKYMFQMEALYDENYNQIPGVATYELYDLHNHNKFVKSDIFDGRPLFGFYDTNEIIRGKRKEIKENDKKPLT